jgi:hypothetical protein
MQKRQIVPHFLIPADQHAPKTVHPTMGALHHPPPGFDPGLLLQCLRLLATRPDRRGEAELVQHVPPLVIVIAFGQTQPRGRLWGGSRRSTARPAIVSWAILQAWRWAVLLEQRPVAFRAFHWQPVRRTKKMAAIAFQSSTRGRCHPKGGGFRAGSKGTMRSHNTSGMRQPSSSAGGSVFLGREWPAGMETTPGHQGAA